MCIRDRSYGELLEFDGGVYGMVMDLEENGVGAVLLDNSDTVGVGDRVRGVDRIVEIPVSDSMIGRVLDPVGRPLDGEAYESKEFLPVARSAPPLIHRHSVDEPLEIGIIAIDSMVCLLYTSSVPEKNISTYSGKAYLGIDCGSTTTKLALLSDDNELLYSFYDSNRGNPVEIAVSYTHLDVYKRQSLLRPSSLRSSLH